MKLCANEVLHHVQLTSSRTTLKKVLLMPFFLFLMLIPLPFFRNSHNNQPSSSSSPEMKKSSDMMMKRCDVFSGKWVPNPRGPYYDDRSCHSIIDQQNCIKSGRPDREYLKWRWRPDECELPLFNAALFLKLVRGKSMAFVGDSVGRNQMESLLCLLGRVSHPKDISLTQTSDTRYFRRHLYAKYNFTLTALWAPYLVTTRDAENTIHSYNSLMNLHLDQPDEAWTTQIKNFDYVIISAGHWFFRPTLYYEKGQIVGCTSCNMNNITDLTSYYGYKMAFRTAFRTLLNLEGYKGVTILRTFSPSHFENGEWNTGGSCPRTAPFKEGEAKLQWFVQEMYLSQVVEFRAAEREGRKKGLRFWLMDTTELMLQRPDGHPNKYGRSKDKNLTVNDCVHWCLPGPVDTWNEFLLYMMRVESQKSPSSML
ncbi:protein trichome birefringence-like 19 [Prosopis cineraria]|uniref:protein trichome birefringence-like 19 n=1 Tax=Prosopis cineraria TaxID=364024 RepID=UPI002410579B|nr:protein trichome birefringence-like 19 [Prosopis cineraria]